MERMVVAGPRTAAGLPRRSDVLGAHLPGGRTPWSFETLHGGRHAPAASTPEATTPPPAAIPPPAPWRLRPGLGVTETGCLLVGLALALAVTPGAGETEQGLVRRRRLTPVDDVVVIPELVTAARPLTELPLALVVTSRTDERALLAELSATTRWHVTVASFTS
ncbi:hypothetical protein [Mobilicoccus pelagius]|uniref:Uncharacterized protein n=1 Tax=Mobilicoccus pelagius NBRC 104925 TaxID=1089455 RepID=H5UNN3_9MICO|nr:hypothetical protein [Mobilicoccus pelagius]GAB47341.1 hypothetical protein MOPEL_009_00310 [Mobilicoccus pelagius NBRC 104925]